MPVNKDFGFIFDMDGVIINTCKLHENSWYNISKLFNFNWDSNINFKEDVFGTSSFDSMRLLFKRDFTQNEFIEICSKKDNLYSELLHESIDSIVMDGFMDFFKNAVNAGITLTLATSATHEEAEFVLKKLDIQKHFKSVINISDVKNPKPDPEIYSKACECMEIPPDNCLGFEDSISGIIALQNAGIKCVVVGSTLSYEKLQKCGLKYHSYISNFSEITLEKALCFLD